MKPVDEKACNFIREFGVKKARDVVASIPVPQVNFYSLDKNTFLELPEEYDPSAYLNANYKVYVPVKDLKRLVESVDLIQKVGGIENAKTFDEYSIYCVAHWTDLEGLQQAIRDHESIYGGSYE